MSAQPLPALVWTGAQYRLARVSPTTLETAAGRSLDVGDSPMAWTYSPRGGRIAMATRKQIRLVDLDRMRVAGRVRGDWDATTGLVWATPGRLLVLNGELSAVQAVANGRVVWSRSLPGTLESWTAIPGGVAVLLGPESGIGMTMLATVDADGTVRTATLDRVSTGTIWPEDGKSLATVSYAALTVDPSTGRAYVIPAGSTAAEVDLATMGVSYHELSQPVSLLGRLHDWLEPPALAKGANGPWRAAEMLGDGLIAVTGSDDRAWFDDRGDLAGSSTASGLQLIDSRSWSVRRVDATTSEIETRQGLLFGAGTSWDGRMDNPKAHGRGLDAYRPDGTRLYHLFADDPAVGLQSANGLGYVWAGSALNVFDVATGAIVSRPKLPATYAPQLLIP